MFIYRVTTESITGQICTILTISIDSFSLFVFHVDVTKEIMANRGLVRKRKKYEGNARVHNRMKFERKTKKLKVRLTRLPVCACRSVFPVNMVYFVPFALDRFL